MYSVSTWFHARKGAVQRFSGPAAPPLIFSRIGREQLLKLAAFEHLHHDIRTADELAFHVKLGDRGPVRIFLDALPYFGVLKDIDGLIARTQPVKDGDGAAGKPALGEERRPFHEQHYVVLLDDV